MMNSARYIVRRITSRSSGLTNRRFGQAIPLRSAVTFRCEAPSNTSTKHGTGMVCTHGVRFMSTENRKFEVINVQDEDDFKKNVIDASSSVPVIVDFHATWCGPCKILGPRLESILAEEKGKVIMAKVDVDENADIAMEYGVRSVPTVIGVKNGKVQDQFIGVINDDEIRAFMDKLIVC